MRPVLNLDKDTVKYVLSLTALFNFPALVSYSEICKMLDKVEHDLKHAVFEKDIHLENLDSEIPSSVLD